MNQPFEPEVLASDYGRQRREAWLAGLRRNAEAAASISAHQADHDVITAGQGGLYGSATPQDLGATVAARTATVGSAWGQGRPMERHGGLYDHAATGPVPARVDLRHANMPPGHQVGESPLARWARERQ